MSAVVAPRVDTAAAQALPLLQARAGLDVWLVTRREEGGLRVLAALGAGAPTGYDLAWEDTLCARMARGEAPRCAPRCADVPAYAGAPLQDRMPVGAYIGAPLVGPAGEVLGSVCGLSPAGQPDTLALELPLVEQVAALLSLLVTQEAELSAWRAAARAAEQSAERDALTALVNRRGWERALLVEESRSDRGALPLSVVVVDLDGFKGVNDRLGHHAGDAYLRAAGLALVAACRPQDVVARVGGDEFAVLAGGCDAAELDGLCRRITGRLDLTGVAASVGGSARRHAEPVSATWGRADAAMYRAKRDKAEPAPWPTVPPGPRLVPDLPADGPPGATGRRLVGLPSEGLLARRALLLLLHVAGGLGAAELAGLQLADVTGHPAGLFVTVADDAAPTGVRHVTLGWQPDGSCPVDAFQRWRELVEGSFQERSGRPMGLGDRAAHPLFCALDRAGRPVPTRLGERGTARVLAADRAESASPPADGPAQPEATLTERA